MTIQIPASWGKLAGTVTGLGRCDTAGAPVALQECGERGRLGAITGSAFGLVARQAAVAFQQLPTMVRIARQRSRDYGGRVHFKIGDASNMAWLAAATFDLVVCNMALMDISDLDPLMRALAKIDARERRSPPACSRSRSRCRSTLPCAM
jgi:hypothetical protein